MSSVPLPCSGLQPGGSWGEGGPAPTVRETALPLRSRGLSVGAPDPVSWQAALTPAPARRHASMLGYHTCRIWGAEA